MSRTATAPAAAGSRTRTLYGQRRTLVHSGVEEFPPLSPDELEDYLAASCRAGWCSRCLGAEDQLRRLDLDLERTRWTGARAHIPHLSSSDALPVPRTAKADGVNLTVETCPHFLTLVSEAAPNGSTAHTCCPPIRDTSNRELLWVGLADGTIDYIASDHSPSTLDLEDLQNGDFGVAWGGIASIQLELSVVWTEARRRGLGLEQVVEWMATRPAERLRMQTKGRIALGYDADLAIFAADDAFVVDAGRLHHKNPLTPYHQNAPSGVVRRTLDARRRGR